MLLALLATCILAAGCMDSPPRPLASADAPPQAAAAPPGPQVFDWTGHVVASDLEGPTHQRPTEDALWPVFQEGILFSVDRLPQAMEVSLDWAGQGEFMIMLHSHKEHGTNVYTEHVTDLDGTNPKCLRVPAEDLAEGAWQVMVHSDGAMQTDFTLHVGLVGGAGHIIEDDRHGHWPQDGAFQVDEHDVLPCSFLLAPA